MSIGRLTPELLTELGFVPIFVELLKSLNTISNSDSLQLRVIKSLRKIAQSSDENRDALNNEEGYLPIISICQTTKDENLLKACLKTLIVLYSDGHCPIKLVKSLPLALSVVLPKVDSYDFNLCLPSAFELLNKLAKHHPIEVSTPIMVSTLINILLDPKRRRASKRAFQVVEELIIENNEVKYLFVEAGLIQRLLALANDHYPHMQKDDISWLLRHLIDGRPFDITACLDATAHIFLFDTIIAHPHYGDDSACTAIVIALTDADPDDFHRLATAPKFFKVLEIILNRYVPVDGAMDVLDRLLDYGLRLGQIQSSEPELGSGVVLSNPILEFLSDKCSNLVDDAGEPLNYRNAQLANILQYVGNGYRPC